jgi:hypothetical protein
MTYDLLLFSIVSRHSYYSKNFCTMTAKRTPYLPCTVTASCLKYRDRCPDGRRVTQPPYIAVPLGAIWEKCITSLYLSNLKMSGE